MNAQLLQLVSPAPQARATQLACLAAASCLHLLLAAAMHDAHPTQDPLPLPPTEIDLSPPPVQPEPKPEPEPEPEPEPPPPAAAPRPVAQARAPRQPAPPSRAGALLTAPETAPVPSAEPVRFVSDPSGRSFGTGSVARGGSADRGLAGAVPSPAPPQPTAAAGLRITPADQLSRQPALLGDGCRGYFPERARQDQGSVTLLATLRADGKVARLQLEAESPTGEGFGDAAKACLTRGQFTPALDDAGHPTAARTRVVVRFAR